MIRSAGSIRNQPPVLCQPLLGPVVELAHLAVGVEEPAYPGHLVGDPRVDLVARVAGHAEQRRLVVVEQLALARTACIAACAPSEA